MTIRWGTCFTPTMPASQLPQLAQAAQASAFDELWVWEDCFAHSAIASAAVALAATSRLQVGIGLMPTPLRAVSLTAMELATLANVYPGRLSAGLGHGVQSWMRQAGVEVDSPLTLLTEQATALRSLLAGEQVTRQGRYVNLSDVQLAWPPTPAPPLFIGGTGPKTVRLAGDLGDGLLLAAARTPDEVAAAAALARSERPDLPVVACDTVVTGPDAARRRAAETELWRPGGAADPVGSAGSAEQIASHLRDLVAAGATHLVVQPTVDEPDVPALLDFVAREVRPLLADLA